MIQEKGCYWEIDPVQVYKLGPNQYPASGKKKKAQQPFKVSSITENIISLKRFKALFMLLHGFT